MRTKLLGLLACLGSLSAFAAGGLQRLPGHVPEQILAAPFLGQVPAPTLIHLAIGLPLRRQGELQDLLSGLYDPQSSRYRHYLSPGQFAVEFGPSAADMEALAAFCRSQGLNPAPGPKGALLNVEGTADAIGKAFHLKLNYYQRPDGSRFHAPDREPSLEFDLPIHHISGLDDFAVPRPHEGTGTGACTSLGYSGHPYVGNDFRSVYLPGVTLDGTGQTVALVEFDNYYASDINLYSGLTSIPVPPLSIRLVDQSKAPHPSTGNGEVALDIEMVMAMSPKASIQVYEQPNRFTFPTVDILNAIAADDSAQAISCSWTWNGGADPNLAPVFLQYAAQGQTFLQASGDLGAYVPGSPSPQVPNPMLSTALLTAVGGTELSTSGAGAGSYVTESTWNNPLERSGCASCNSVSGGGIVSGMPIPTWQAGMDMSSNGGSAVLRNLPDISMIGDNLQIYADNGNLYCSGGTSASAPLWAGLVCLVNQRAQANGLGNAGFLNPALYGLAKNATTYAADFHDVNDSSSNNYTGSGSYLAVTGYDLATGWGSPKASLIDDLAGLAPTVPPTSTTTLTRSPTRTATVTLSLTVTRSATITFSKTPTPVPSNTRTAAATATLTTVTTATDSPTRTPIVTATLTQSRTQTRTFTLTAPATATVTMTPIQTAIATATITRTPTQTAIASATVSRTPTQTAIASATVSRTPTVTSASTLTNTPVTLVPSITSSDTPSITATLTNTGGSPATATATTTSVPQSSEKMVVITPEHAGGDVALLLSKPGATVAGVVADIYAIDLHRVSHWESPAGASPSWHTAGVAPGVYYLKFAVQWSDGSSTGEMIRKVVLRP